MRKKTFEQAKKELEGKFSYLTLLSYNGTNYNACFLDKYYGKFEGNYYRVYKGKKKHPKRSALNKKEKTIKTNLKRYGVKNVRQYFTFNDKANQSNLDRYGTKYPTQNSKIKQKIKQTNLQKYGVENPQQNKEIKEKTIKTNLQKYGARNPFQSEKIKDKIKKTCLEKYGIEHFSKTKLFKDKYINTCQNKFGVDNPSQFKEIQDKKIKTSLKKYGTIHPSQNEKIQNKIQKTRNKKGLNKIINGLSYKEIANKYGYAYTTIVNYINCGNDVKSLHNKKKFSSLLEQTCYNILQKYNINFKYGFSENIKIYKNKNYYKPDFIVDDLVIECDGLYWHSECKYDKNYHKNKQLFFKSLGYRSLFFREDEIINKTPIVESIILAKLGLISNRVYARKCEIRQIKPKEASKFFEENHLMGRGTGKCFALFYNDEIVSAIRVVNKKNYLDVSRFCNKLNTSVAGGLSKLLKHIIKKYNPNKIVSFVDMRYGEGSSLKKLGFQEKANYVSFKWTDFKQTFHRMNFSKNSGYEKGLYKIWDCGQKKFELCPKI